MKIMNLMLSRGRGGIEQAFVNSVHAIQNYSDFNQVCIIDQKSKVGGQLNIQSIKLRQFADWDPVAICQLYRLIKTVQPNIILCHGNRPLKMVLRIKSFFGLPASKIIGFCHNFSIKHLLKSDGIISVSKYIRDNHILPSGYPAHQAFHVPNMINMQDYEPIPEHPHQNPIHIGTMGRFVKKKGFEDYIRALKILVDRGHTIQATLGGTGDEEQRLKSLATELNLDSILNFSGWIYDKREFYKDLDIFCLPSREEPFGIIALDTLAYGTLMVATRTTGPNEFLIDGENSILCEHTNPLSLANALETAIKINHINRSKIIEHGFETVKNYDLPSISQQLITALKNI